MHEPLEFLSGDARGMHRVIVSLMEEAGVIEERDVPDRKGVSMIETLEVGSMRGR